MDPLELPDPETIESLYVDSGAPAHWTTTWCDDRFTVAILNPGEEAVKDVWVDDRDTDVPAFLQERGHKVATLGTRELTVHHLFVFAAQTMREFADGKGDLWAKHPFRPADQ